MTALRVSVFEQLPLAPGQDAGARLHQLLSEAEAAESLGFDTYWVAESHLMPAFSLLSAPLAVLAALSQRTRRLRLGVAALSLPLHHPLRLAGELGTLDRLSCGRLRVCVGRGPVATADAFGADASAARLEEVTDALLATWRDPAGAWPRPGDGDPPVEVAANSPATAARAAERGWGMLMGANAHPWPGPYGAFVAGYRTAWTSAGHRGPGRVGVVLYVAVAGSAASARARLAESFAAYAEVVGRRWDMDEVVAGMGLVGTAAECRDRLAAMQLAAPVDEVLCCFNPGGMVPPDAVTESMERFSREVAAPLGAGGGLVY